jgi:hypothetical protein
VTLVLLEIIGTDCPSLPGDRFVYLSWWRDGEGMFRRAKLMLDSLPSYEDQVLTVRLAMRDGSPLCAAVRPPVLVWQTNS